MRSIATATESKYVNFFFNLQPLFSQNRNLSKMFETKLLILCQFTGYDKTECSLSGWAVNVLSGFATTSLDAVKRKLFKKR